MQSTNESPIERRFREAWQRRAPHLPLASQYPVLQGRYRLDFAYPPAKIAVELDGYAYHSDKTQFTRDRQRGRDLDRAGWRVLRFSGQEIHHTVEQCVDEVQRAIEAVHPASAHAVGRTPLREYHIRDSGPPAFPPGTRMLYQQTERRQRVPNPVAIIKQMPGPASIIKLLIMLVTALLALAFVVGVALFVFAVRL